MYFGADRPWSFHKYRELEKMLPLAREISVKYPDRITKEDISKAAEPREYPYKFQIYRQFDAVDEVVGLDSKGASPQEALAPLNALTEGEVDKSADVDWFHVPTGEELLLGAANELFDLYANRHLRPSFYTEEKLWGSVWERETRTITPRLILPLLVLWEETLRPNGETLEVDERSDFNVDENFGSLVKAYAALGEIEPIERLIGPRTEENEYFFGLWTGDFIQAWAHEKKLHEMMGATFALNALEFAAKLNDQEAVSLISNDVINPAFYRQKSTDVLNSALSYVDPALRAKLEDIVLARDDLSVYVRAGLYMRRGEEETYWALIAPFEENVKSCTSAAECKFFEYLRLLGGANKAIRARSVMTTELAKEYLNRTPFPPYEAEGGYSELPSTLYWMLDELSEHQPSQAVLNLLRCIRNGLSFNNDHIEICLDLALELAKSPQFIEFETQRMENQSAPRYSTSGSWGRYSLSHELLEFSNALADINPVLSDRMEEEAITLIEGLPPIPLTSSSVLKELAMRRLKLRAN